MVTSTLTGGAATWNQHAHSVEHGVSVMLGGDGKQKNPAPIKTGWALTVASSVEVELMSCPI